MFGIIKATTHYFNEKLWKIRLDRVEGRRGTFIRQLRVFTLSIKGFTDDKCLLKATALTYYTLFSIVPVIALTFAIAKGFGYETDLQMQLMDKFKDQKEVLGQAFGYANKLLENAKGGIIAGIGVLLLLFSVIRLLSNIEQSFNEIWEIKKGRTWIRKFTDYLSIILIAPLLIIVSGSITVVIESKLEAGMSYVGLAPESPFIVMFAFKAMSFALLFAMFAFLYMVLPNTKVKFQAAAKAAIISAILFQIVQWLYIAFQIGVGRSNAIYGSFAALPLFLFWVQTSWFIVLFGAELAFAYQNVDHYELEHEIQHISIRYKRVLALLIAQCVIKNFTEGGKPMTSAEIAKKLDLPVRLARNIIHEFDQLGIFNEVKTEGDQRESAYQPALSENKLTIKYILEKLDTAGVNEMPIQYSNELASIQNAMDGFDHLLENDKGNILVKDIA
jgi:membrane protein